jgi:TM2 domain-containing membrane protein YozV
MNFFIRRANQEFGPYTETDLRNYVASGNILPSELARAEGAMQFSPVSAILTSPPPSGNVAVAAPSPLTSGGAVPPPQYQQPMGQGQPWPTPYPQQKERIAYILLGVFLGAFGIHNFYAGYTGRAIAQLLITLLTLFVGSIISVVWAIIEVCTVTVDASGVPFK